MRSFALLLLATLSLAACQTNTGAIRGTAMQTTDGSAKPAARARIMLYSVDSPSRHYAANADASGRYALSGVVPGGYLRVAYAERGYESALTLLRQMIGSAKDLEQITGYDAIGNMPDELKAAIAFDKQPAPPPGESDSVRKLRVARQTAQREHLEATIRSYMDSWPQQMKSMFPNAGVRPADMTSLQIIAGETTTDSVSFLQSMEGNTEAGR